MTDYLKEHGAKIALGLGAIVVTYVLYTCVVAPEEPNIDEKKEVTAPAENESVVTAEVNKPITEVVSKQNQIHNVQD